MSDDRRLDVLRAIVTEYVNTCEPVGSKVIAQSHDLGVSSATIRNDMAVLEEAGLIFQPHTSAGRVPTDNGYRVFVDRLCALKPMSAPERRAVETFLDASADVDEVVERTVRLLAQVTHQVAVIEYPTLQTQTLRRIEIIDLAPTRLLLIAITSEGHVGEHTLDLPRPVDSGIINTLRSRLNSAYEGLACCDIAPTPSALADLLEDVDADLIAALVPALVELLAPPTDSRIVMAGISNLARGAVDFRDIAPVLDALEEQVVLLRLFDELQSDDDVHVTIGTENPDDSLAEASVVTGTYRTSPSVAAACAHLGVVGPTRMDYARTMSSVRAVAAYLSRYLTR